MADSPLPRMDGQGEPWFTAHLPTPDDEYPVTITGTWRARPGDPMTWHIAKHERARPLNPPTPDEALLVARQALETWGETLYATEPEQRATQALVEAFEALDKDATAGRLPMAWYQRVPEQDEDVTRLHAQLEEAKITERQLREEAQQYKRAAELAVHNYNPTTVTRKLAEDKLKLEGEVARLKRIIGRMRRRASQIRGLADDA